MKKFFVLVLALGIAIGLVANAQASLWPEDPVDLATYLSGVSKEWVLPTQLGGPYKVMAIAHEAGNDLEYYDGWDNLLFTKDPVSDYGIWKKVDDLSTTYFKDLSAPTQEFLFTDWDNRTSSEGYYVQAYRLLESWTPPWGAGAATPTAPIFEAGTIIFGFNDLGGDDNHDDFILAARQVPIPGALWLLGSGLIGLVGLRRKLKG